MILPKQPRFTMALVMLLVLTSAAAAALFVKIKEHIPPSGPAILTVDSPALFVISIGLTAIALGALKSHSAGQMMFQMTLACLGYLSLIGLAEAKWERPLLYWFQASFALMVAAPLVARKLVKAEMARGPRRDWWKNTLEAIVFAFLSMWLVLLGILMEVVGLEVVPGLLK